MIIGGRITDIETPALMIDAIALDRNIKKMQTSMNEYGCDIRPHFKTHKCPVIAHKQIRNGAVGITCAKLGEAEVLAKSGVRNILIANEIVDVHKINRLAGISRYCNIMTAVDSNKNVQDLSEAAAAFKTTLGVLIEVDVGIGRCGVRDLQTALELARVIEKSPGVSLWGIMGYEGHCVFIHEIEERKSKTRKANSTLVQYKDYLAKKGFNMDIVSGAGTGTYNLAASFDGMTEIQAGSYVFMDAKYNTIEGLDFENSLFLLATVISRPCPGIAITDSGMKCITHEFGLPLVVSHTDASLTKLSEEHGKLEFDETRNDISIGDRIRIMPSHCCTTVNLHDRYYVTDGQFVVDVWEISARGKFV